MKSITILHLVLVLLAVPVSSSFADDQPANIQITLKSDSLWKKYFEVSDEVCNYAVPNECKMAEIMSHSDKCKHDKWKDECNKAKEIVESAECVEGIIFYGWLEPGQTVQLSICSSHTGSGRIKTRNSPTAPWTHHSWVESGATISIK